MRMLEAEGIEIARIRERRERDDLHGGHVPPCWPVCLRMGRPVHCRDDQECH